MNKKMSNVKALGVFVLAMINVAAVLSLRNFPPMAEYGWSSIGWYLIGTITFLIPVELGGRGTRHRLAQRAAACTRGCRRPSATRRVSSPFSANGQTTWCGSPRSWPSLHPRSPLCSIQRWQTTACICLQ